MLMPQDSRTDRLELLRLLQEKNRRAHTYRYKDYFASRYPWQVNFIAATKEYSQVALIAANRVGKCLTKQTLISTPDGDIPLANLLGGEFEVNTIIDGKVNPSLALKPFSKGEHPCFRVVTTGGEFEAADFHRFMCGGVWIFPAELHCLLNTPAEYVRDLLESISERDPLAHVSDVQHLTQKASDSHPRCSEDFHQCDELPQSSADSVAGDFPSQADALRRILAWYGLGVLVNKDIDSLSLFLYHLSSMGEDCHREDQFFEFLYQAGSKYVERLNGQCQALRLLNAVASPNPQSCGGLLLQCASAYLSGMGPFDNLLNESNSIVSCNSIGSKEVFDFKVPETGTYLAGGVLHHNTNTATYIDAIHALGEYPAEWPGHKFSHAPLIWCLGYSGEKCRDLLQSALIGTKIDGQYHGGLIPPDRIISTEPMTGTPNGVRSVLVRHISGELSKIQFWSYTQGQHALMGDSVDWFHIDEEPQDPDIWPQVLVRTAAGDQGKGGRGILTFTPENGRTSLVVQFMDSPGPSQHCMPLVSWDEAPHLSEKVRIEMLAAFPPYQRDMRTKGIPMLGHGRIYDLGEDAITCDPFPIPSHFKVINGMDFGWDHPQAQVQLAIDEDNDIIYVTRAWKARHTSPGEAWSIVNQWARGVPTAWPSDGLQTEKGSGKQQMSYYKDVGFSMLEEEASWEDNSRYVEPGLFEIYDRMMHGRFKVFRGLRDFFDEFNLYCRDEKGKIVKSNDDVLDSVRIAIMMRRYAKYYGELSKPKEIKMPAPLRPVSRMR